VISDSRDGEVMTSSGDELALPGCIPANHLFAGYWVLALPLRR
jgi:hypothetical protein